MPDVHLASEVCVGVALATSDRLIPAAVGSDIGCGMAALGLDIGAEVVEDPERARALLRALGRAIPVLRHRAIHQAPGLPPELACDLSDPSLTRAAAQDGRLQLGSLGRGNHFLELQADEDGGLWIMLHSGSRSIGQRIRKHHEARGLPDAAGLRGLSASSPEGEAYLADLAWALVYARHNRARMLARAEACLWEVLGAQARPDSRIECHHNFVRRESIGGRELWVHRKGAISAHKDELGIIPGSMGDPSFHVVGRGLERALCSSSHGAGRVMSRTQARRRISVQRLHRELDGVVFDHRLAARLREEAPGAYKDIGKVMRAQRPLTRVNRRLRPLLSYKGA